MSVEAMKRALNVLENKCEATHSAITALRQAIAEAEKHKCTYPHCSYPCPDLPDCIDAKKQEPVIDKTAAIRIATALGWKPAEQCPDCEYNKARAARWRAEAYKLTGHEVELPWVGLTPEERDKIQEQVHGAVPHHVAFAHAIEQALKERNT